MSYQSSADIRRLMAHARQLVTERVGLDHNKPVIYTCITNSYNELPAIPFSLLDDFNFICFTDQGQVVRAAGWSIFPLNFQLANQRLTAKAVKILPHHLFLNHKLSIWVDGNIVIKNSVSDIFRKFEASSALIGLISHDKRNCLYEEAKCCLRWGKDEPKRIKAQVTAYKAAGVKRNQGLYQGRFLLRRHTEEACSAAMDLWWDQIITYSIRDQISLPFIIMQNNLDVWNVDIDDFAQACEVVAHKKYATYLSAGAVGAKTRALLASLIYFVSSKLKR
ncbi:MAG: glycosyltransferase domain-containing protein [Candidatus Ranarchaeia archaeon]